MPELSDYYFSLGEVLATLAVVGGGALALFWKWRKDWQKRLVELRQKQADALANLADEDARFRAWRDHFQSAVAHEFVKGLDYILNKSRETRDGLQEDQIALRDKQDRIIAKSHEMARHARNILDILAPPQDESPQELLNLRDLVTRVLLDLYAYAESRGVTLRSNLADVEPTMHNRHLTRLVVENVLHNAIKYSLPGGVVQMNLTLEESADGERTVCIAVRDTGRGIAPEDQATIFDLNVRGDGLVETGNGLGLYLAREAARRQGGDVLLINSQLNHGSTFHIVFPYSIVPLEEGP